MELHLNIIGFTLIPLGLIHAIFPSYFNWKTELQPLSLVNRQMMIVHTFSIALAVILMGLLCVTSANELVDTPLGQKICLGMGFFWTCRFFIQFFGYSKKLWKGKQFETIVHVVFSCYWLYLSVVFLMIGFQQAS